LPHKSWLNNYLKFIKRSLENVEYRVLSQLLDTPDYFGFLPFYLQNKTPNHPLHKRLTKLEDENELD